MLSIFLDPPIESSFGSVIPFIYSLTAKGTRLESDAEVQ